MRLETYTSAQRFLKHAQPYLQEQASVNNLMLGLAARIQQSPELFEQPPFMCAVNDQQGLALAALQTPPHNLLLYSARSNPRDVLQLLVSHLQNNGHHLPGVHGAVSVADAFAREWAQANKIKTELAMRLGVYELQNVVFPQDIAGAGRKATLDDSKLIIQWTEAFLAEASPNDPRYNVQAITTARINEGAFYVWEENSQLVCMAAKVRESLNTASIGYVYTPDEHRKRGYASACVAALSQLLLNEGWSLCNLFTNLDNPTSNSIYQKIGYQRVGDCNVYRFK